MKQVEYKNTYTYMVCMIRAMINPEAVVENVSVFWHFFNSPRSVSTSN